jgi:hypothetical protein
MAQNHVHLKRKGPRRILFLSLLIIGIFLAFPFLLWKLSPASPWSVVVLDQTVPHPDYREHHSLFWCLNHAKVHGQTGKTRWKTDRDYIGFYPEKFVSSNSAYASALQPLPADKVDLLFIADSYGVYRDDYIYPERYWTHLDYSQKIFGGFDIQEVEIIEEFVKKGGALVLEFNTFHSPSTQEAQERLEALMGLRWSGWMGRFFFDLSDEEDVPVWAWRHWEAHHDQEWNFSGPGFLIAHEDTRLFVLEGDKDLEIHSLQIILAQPDDPLLKGVSQNVPYYYWYDIVYPDPSTEILAQYKFQVTVPGKEKLREFGVPEEFPAVLRASRLPLKIYFAGDFSDNRVYRGPYFLSGWPQFRRFLCLFSSAQDQNTFYWRFYVPFLKNLFKGSSP